MDEQENQPQKEGAPCLQQNNAPSRQQLYYNSNDDLTTFGSHVQSTARSAYTNYITHLLDCHNKKKEHCSSCQCNIMKKEDRSTYPDVMSGQMNLNDSTSYRDSIRKRQNDFASDQDNSVKMKNSNDLTYHYQDVTKENSAEQLSVYQKTTASISSSYENTNETKNNDNNMVESSPLMDLREFLNIDNITTPDHGAEEKSSPSRGRIFDHSKTTLLSSPMLQLVEGQGGQINNKELLMTRERQNEEQNNSMDVNCSSEIQTMKNLLRAMTSRDRLHIGTQAGMQPLPLSNSGSSSTPVAVASDRLNTMERRSLVISPPRSRSPRDDLQGRAFEHKKAEAKVKSIVSTDAGQQDKEDKEEAKSRQAAVLLFLSQPAVGAGTSLASSAFSLATSRWKSQAPVGSEKQSPANLKKPRRHCRLARSLSRPARFVAAAACVRVAGGIHQRHKGDEADAGAAGRGEGDGGTEGGPPAGLEGSKGEGYDGNEVSRDPPWLVEDKGDLSLRIQSSLFDEDLTGVTSSNAASLQDNPSTTTATDVEQNAERDGASSTSQTRLEQGGDGVISSQEKSLPPSDSDVLGVTVSASLSSGFTQEITSTTQDLAASGFLTPPDQRTVPTVKYKGGSVSKLPSPEQLLQREEPGQLFKSERLFLFFKRYAELKQPRQAQVYRLEKGYFKNASVSDLKSCIHDSQKFAQDKQGTQATAARPAQEPAGSAEPSLSFGLLDKCFLSAREVALIGIGSYGSVWVPSPECNAARKSIVVKHQYGRDDHDAMVEACFAMFVSSKKELAPFVAQAREAVSVRFIDKASSTSRTATGVTSTTQEYKPHSFLVMDRYSRSLQDQVLREHGQSPLKAGISLSNNEAERPVGTLSRASPRVLEEASIEVAKRFIKRGKHMIDGVVELGKLGIASRDIKLTNYLVDDEAGESPVITDWGSSTAYGEDDYAERKGTAVYQDPLVRPVVDELADGATVTYLEMDAWGLGDALLELWTSLEAGNEILHPSIERVTWEGPERPLVMNHTTHQHKDQLTRTRINKVKPHKHHGQGIARPSRQQY
ncbi:unnamed protein product [Amoebophrya sp. A25]|nr:unnamed protein product [Amoebophrya sp. A25]|eukprot:GSA25T00014807001.1